MEIELLFWQKSTYNLLQNIKIIRSLDFLNLLHHTYCALTFRISSLKHYEEYGFEQIHYYVLSKYFILEEIMGLITGYICLILLLLLLALFISQKFHLKKMNAFLMKIHKNILNKLLRRLTATVIAYILCRACLSAIGAKCTILNSVM